MKLQQDIIFANLRDGEKPRWLPIFKEWERHEEYAFTHYDYCEPIRGVLDDSGYNTILEIGTRDMPLFSRKKPSLTAGIVENQNISEIFETFGYPLRSKISKYIDRCMGIANAVEALYVSIHPIFPGSESMGSSLPWPHLSQHQSSTIIEKHLLHTKQSWGTNMQIYTEYIPDVFWFTLFGPLYVKFIGKEKLLSSPCYKVFELDYGAVALQLTKDPKDLLLDLPEALALREGLKEHLGREMFFDPVKGCDYAYRIPDVRGWIKQQLKLNEGY